MCAVSGRSTISTVTVHPVRRVRHAGRTWAIATPAVQATASRTVCREDGELPVSCARTSPVVAAQRMRNRAGTPEVRNLFGFELPEPQFDCLRELTADSRSAASVAVVPSSASAVVSVA